MVFAIRVHVLIEDTRVAVQVLSEPENYQAIVILLTAVASWVLSPWFLNPGEGRGEQKLRRAYYPNRPC